MPNVLRFGGSGGSNSYLSNLYSRTLNNEGNQTRVEDLGGSVYVDEINVWCAFQCNSTNATVTLFADYSTNGVDYTTVITQAQVTSGTTKYAFNLKADINLMVTHVRYRITVSTGSIANGGFGGLVLRR